MSSYDLISTRSIRRRYAVVNFLIWFATALPLALSVLLVQSRGLSLTQIGFVLGAYSLIIVLLEVPTGGLADAAGRKRVALVAHALAAVSSLALLLAFSFPGYVAAMALYGVSRALASGALDAWYVDALQAAEPDYDLQPALAEVESVTMLALGAGTLIGGALPRLFAGLPPDGTAVLTPLAVPIVAALVIRLILLPVIFLLIPESRAQGDTTRWRDGFRQVPALVREATALSRSNPRLMLLMTASVVAGFALMSLESFWQPFFAALPAVAERGPAATTLLGVIMAGNFVAGIAGNLLSPRLGRLLARGGDKRHALLAALSRLWQGLFLLALAASSALLPAAGFFWLIYLTSGVGLSPHATLVNEEIPAARRSAMLSVQSLAFFAGGFLGGAVLGRVADQWNIAVAWAIAGALVVVSVIPYVVLARRESSLAVSASGTMELDK